MESTPKKIEVEGKEIMIKSSDGYNAIIPKAKASEVKAMLDKKDFKAIDKYVRGLPQL
jgi:hypothetical protein